MKSRGGRVFNIEFHDIDENGILTLKIDLNQREGSTSGSSDKRAEFNDNIIASTHGNPYIPDPRNPKRLREERLSLTMFRREPSIEDEGKELIIRLLHTNLPPETIEILRAIENWQDGFFGDLREMVTNLEKEKQT